MNQMNQTTDLYHRFLKNIEKYELVDGGDTIIIAASGGPDSQLLVHLFSRIKNKFNLRIILAHLNHLHRDDADLDEKLVFKTAEDLGLDIKMKRASMDEYARNHLISPEDAGRRLRYEFFNEIAHDIENSKIAVAHNMDDQAETVIMRMIRGTGIDGLAAMDYKSQNIIRPILDFKKSDILAYLDKNKIVYNIDKTNLESDYTRNFIRHEIIPKMEMINPKTIDNIFNLTSIAKDELYIINKTIEDVFNKVSLEKNSDLIKFDKKSFDNQSKPIQKRIIRHAISLLKDDTKDISSLNIDNFLLVVDLGVGKKIVKDDIVFINNSDNYSLYLDRDKEPFDKLLYLDSEVIFYDKIIKASLVDKKSSKNKNVKYFDYNKLDFPLIVRSRKPGDRFNPEGFSHSKKVKDYFIDEKIDQNLRDTIPIITSNDKIVLVAGFRASREFGVDETSSKILKIEVKDDN